MLLIIIVVIFQSLAGLFMKLAANDMTNMTIMSFISNKSIWLAIICLVFQSIIWQFVLRKQKLSYAYYFMSMRYFITLGFGYYLFNEKVTYLNILGLIVIAGGIIIFALGKTDA
ncbi:MAG: hypothetical protein K9J13_00460 [Saprospiraceae bacterium]|nr:hypothetical protein [Saprospiraceae bacterium]